MIPSSPPDNAPFRITFFFGPDRVGRDEDHWRCVFNVKKRSWKGGVQVSVDISQAQVEKMHATLNVAGWMTEALETTPDGERSALRQRIEEVFIQALCGRKLDLALQSGLAQQNQEIPAHAFTHELDRSVRSEREHIFASLRTELDLDDPSHSIP